MWQQCLFHASLLLVKSLQLVTVFNKACVHEFKVKAICIISQFSPIMAYTSLLI